MGLTSNIDSTYELVFENGRPGSEENLKSLFRSAFDPYLQLLGRGLSENDYDWLPKFVEDGNVWLALREDKLIGAIAVIPEGESWSIDLIAIPPKLQNKGTGSWMLEKIEEIASS